VPSWLYNPKTDLTLLGNLTLDPFFTTWPGLNYYGSGLSITAGRRDLRVFAPTGAARYPQLVVTSTTGLTDEIWVNDSPLSGTNPIRPGDYINPNRNQSRWFRVIQVIDSGGVAKIRVAADAGINITDLATAGDIAVVVPRLTYEHDKQMRAIMPLVLPLASRLLVYYQ